MRLRLVFASFFIFALPILFPASPNPEYDLQYGSVAFAGHTSPSGRWCECGSAGCICDPGEVPPGGQGLTVAGSTESNNQTATSIPSNQAESVDLGSGLLAALAVAVTLWLKMRA